MEHQTKDTISGQLEHITTYLGDHIINDHAIVGGLGGLYYLFKKGKQIPELYDRCFQILDDGFSSYETKEGKLETYGEGFVSYGALFKLLTKNGICEFEDYPEIITLIDEFAVQYGKLHIGDNNFDFLYGATGMIHYLLLCNEPGKHDAFISYFLETLESKAIPSLGGLCWTDEYFIRKENRQVVNMGLAHGILSIISVLSAIEASGMNVDKKKVHKLLQGAITFTVNAVNKDPQASSLFPNFYYLEHPEEHKSRMGWCYGDLCNGYKLYQVATRRGDKQLVQFALDAVDRTLSRRTTAETGIEDASFCHGASGIMYLYHKLYKATGQRKYADAALYWAGDINRFCKPGAPYAGYLNAATDHPGKNMGLIDGISGIGLAMDSYLTGDFGWDDLLLLQD